MPGEDKDYKGGSWLISDKPAFEQDVYNFRDIHDHDFDRFNQHCNKTMIGFVQKTKDPSNSFQQHEIQCFYGILNEFDEPVSAVDANQTAGNTTAKLTKNASSNSSVA